MADVKNVTTAKPKVGGAIHRAPLGTALPTDAKATLNAAFKSLGYCSEDGVANNEARTTENIKAWGGAIVHTSQTEKTDNFTWTLIEALNVEVLKDVCGDDNVTGDLDTGITIKANSKELEEHCYVVDTILNGGVLKRIVIPRGKITSIGEKVYKDNQLLGYACTIGALPNDAEDTHYEYIAK